MVDTAGTLTKAADLMIERCKKRTCNLYPSNTFWSTYQRLEDSKLEELIVTDSIPTSQESSKIRVLSCADLFADVMHKVHQNDYQLKIRNVNT